MRYTIWFVLLAIGCGDSGELAALKSLLANAQESIVETQATQIDKTDEAIVILKDNTTALAAIQASIDALPVVSKAANSEEVIQSTAPNPPAKANTALAPLKVATPGDFSRVASDGTRLRWDVQGNWNPTILETSAHLREHGIDTNGMTHQEMADIHASIHDGQPVAMKSETVRYVSRGTSCPNGQCPTSSTRYVRRSRR
jgi:hypothetical protein